MSTADDLKAAVATTRDDLARVEADANQAATVLSELEDALDRLRRGDDPTPGSGTVAELVDGVDAAFRGLQREEFGFLLEDVEAAYDDYAPDDAGAVATTFRDAYRDDDQAAFEAGIQEVLDLLADFGAPDLDDRLEKLREAFDGTDDEAFETAVDELLAFYDAVHLDRFDDLTSNFERLFGHTYQQEASGHVSDLRTAFADRDERDFETGLSALETTFGDDHAAAFDRRANQLDSGLRDGQVGQAETQFEALQADARAARRRVHRLIRRLNDDLDALVNLYPSDPTTPLSALDDPLQPVVMLPVQLETRFTDVDSQGNCRLQIRVAPDDVHVDTHEPELTGDEVAAGRQFWERLWWAAHDVPTSNLAATLSNEGAADLVADVDLEDLPEDPVDRHDAVSERAWADLVERVGDPRAGYVKTAMAPGVKAELLDGPPHPDGLSPVDFDTLDDDVQQRPGAWTRQPRARLLPDRWVAFVDTGSGTLTATSSHVKEPLPIGPEPDVVGTGGSAPTWMADFREAERVGMGLEVELDESTARDGLESVVVVGVKASMDPDETARALGDLLDAHHYTDGLELLPQGTPTNNTGEGGTPRSSRTDPAASAPVECAEPLAREGTDGWKLARLLALDPDQLGGGDHVFAHVAGADGVEQRDARHMHEALWSATWGYFVPHMLAPADSAGSAGGADYGELAAWLSAYREHFVEYVRGRGPAPALRVGDQPYGVLPATTYPSWQELTLSGGSGGGSGGAGFSPTTYGDRDVQPDLVTAVNALRSAWAGSTDSVQTMSDVDGAPDPVAALLEVLGREPRSIGYRYRHGFGRTTLLWALSGNPPPYTNIGSGNVVQSEVDQVKSGPGAQLVQQAFGGSMPDARVTEALFWERESDPLGPLVGQDTEAYIAKLLTMPFDAIAVGDPARREAYGHADSALDELQDRMDIEEEGRADSLLEMLLYYATLREYADARLRLGDLYGGGPWTVSPGSAWHLVPEPELYEQGEDTVFDRMRDPVPSALTDHPHIESDDRYVDVLEMARDLDPGAPAVAPAFESFVNSLRYLLDRELDDEVAERLLTETLDLASYRFDAWATSIATRRLDRLRAHQAADGTASDPGVYVGAVGWVTDLSKRSTDPVSDGYVHTPSLPQATTAAVLRNGSTSFDGERGELLSIDLSPERVENARTLIDDVRGGEDLSELLGYRFERALRESEEDIQKYIRDFRALEPAVAGEMDREDGGSTNTAARRDVVDGLALYRRWDDDDGSIPWGADVEGSGTSEVRLPDEDEEEDEEEYAAIVGVLEDIEDLLDATSDLLVAESAHQVLNGKPTRAGASLDALSRGEAPSELEVIDTPRSGTALTHRMLVLFGDSPPSTSWPSAPRQVRPDAEPNLDAWVADLLPDPTEVACVCAWERTDDDGSVLESDQVGVRLADLAVAPLDVISVAEGGADAQRSELEQRVLYHVDREEQIPEEAEIELLFGPVEEWPHDADDLGLGDSLDEFVSFGAVLAVAGALQDVVATGRPVDAGDLRRAGPSTDSGLDATALADRADAVVPALQSVVDDLDKALSVLEADTEGDDDLTGLTDAAAAIGSVPPGGVGLKNLAAQLDAIDSGAVVSELETVEATLDGGLLSLATLDGTVQVEADVAQEIRGRVAAPKGTVLKIVVKASGSMPMLLEETATVGSDGAFEATLDFGGVPAGTAFEVEVLADSGPIADPTSGEVVASVDGSPTADESVGPLSTPALDEFVAVVRDVSGVAAALEPAREAFDRTDLAAIQTVETVFDYGDVDSAPGWDPSWPSNVDAMVDRLLSIPPLLLPGTDHATLTADGWERPYEFALLLNKGTDLLAYPPAERSDLATIAGDVVALRDTTLESAIGDATGTVASELRDLAPLAGGTAEDAAAAVRLGVLEGVRDALLRAAGFGVGASVPQSARGIDADDQATLTRQAAAVASEAHDRLETAPSAGDGADAGTHLERIEAVFGEGFTVLAPFAPTDAGELDNALTAAHSDTLQNGDELAVETWFQRAARIRDVPGRFQRALEMAESLDGTVTDAGLDAARFRVGQLPYRDDDDWVGLPDAFSGDPPGGRLSLVTHAGTAHEGAPAAGLFVDEWVETVPAETETTGLAFQHDRPTNHPPQSVLVAVPPDDAGWSPARLRDVAEETLSMARMRTIDTARLEDLGHFLPALTYAHNTTRDGTGPDTISLDFSILEGY